MAGLSEDVVAGITELALFEILRQRLQKVVVVPTPAAGADWVQTVPAGVAWEVLSVFERLVTSAVVATRSLNLDFKDPDGTRIIRYPYAAGQAASLTTSYALGAGYGAIQTTNEACAPLPSPPILVPANWTIQSATNLIDVADQHSLIFLVVREWQIRETLLNVEWIKNHAR